jgi:2-polyprenyl-3-methyl-5-hydroxy-6-metoxy-1,4-benzoquinol methylase
VKQTASEVLTGCPLCGAGQFKEFLHSCDYSITQEDFTIVQCTHCGLKFTNPRPNDAEIGRYYESEDYISHSNTSNGLVNTAYQAVRTYTIRQKTHLYHKLAGNQPKTVLDYGCGTGELLKSLKNSGWDTLGIEPGDKPREFAIRENKLHVKTPDALPAIETGAMTIISMWHVLEHVHRLNETVAELKRILSENGTLIVAVPNSDSYDSRHYKQFWAAYDLPRHLYHFNKTTITELFKRHNMLVEQVKPMIFDSFYVSMLSEKYSTGKTNYFSALKTGLKTNFHGKSKIENYSSLIFMIKKSKSKTQPI